MTKLDLAGIRARAEAASKWIAPWLVEGPPKDQSVWCSEESAYGPLASYVEDDAAAHIAGMDPPTTLALVDALEATKALIEDHNDKGVMPRGGIRHDWWAVAMLEIRGRKAAEKEAAKLRARVAELEAK